MHCVSRCLKRQVTTPAFDCFRLKARRTLRRLAGRRRNHHEGSAAGCKGVIRRKEGAGEKIGNSPIFWCRTGSGISETCRWRRPLGEGATKSLLPTVGQKD